MFNTIECISLSIQLISGRITRASREQYRVSHSKLANKSAGKWLSYLNGNVKYKKWPIIIAIRC